jgi:hypothetical protein
VTNRRQLSQSLPAKLQIRQTGAIMYELANIDFSNRLGVVVSDLSELPPDEIDRRDHTLDAKRVATDKELEMAVFGAA